jgi:hypothetical protein
MENNFIINSLNCGRNLLLKKIHKFILIFRNHFYLKMLSNFSEHKLLLHQEPKE